jgi:uncharacterized Tic20 family protein
MPNYDGDVNKDLRNTKIIFIIILIVAMVLCICIPLFVNVDKIAKYIMFGFAGLFGLIILGLLISLLKSSDNSDESNA